ncbi:MAG: sigma-E factor negative regulatory protein RseB [Pseudomonadota bacterium]|jgi:sigma-E factor negative regulatory protein RseB
MPRLPLLFVCLAYLPWLWAQEATQWLKQAMHAAQRLNYAGTVVVQRGAQLETVRIAHVNDGQQEIERLLTMDGQMREAIRVGDQITTYIPDVKLVRVEPRAGRHVFPALAPQQVEALSKNYQMRLGAQERVAGHEAQMLMFMPKDANRFPYVLWAELRTGLLLKTQIVNEHNELLEQVLFTDVQLGNHMNKASVRPTFVALANDWQYETLSIVSPLNMSTGWSVSELPPGFIKVREGFRSLPGLAMPVVHLVFSDGIASVSVFIEHNRGADALPSRPQAGQAFFRRQLAEYTVTAIGETPFAAVQTIAMNIQAPSHAMVNSGSAAVAATQAALNRIRGHENTNTNTNSNGNINNNGNSNNGMRAGEPPIFSNSFSNSKHNHSKK